MVRRAAPGAEINVVPNLRGTIIAYGGQRVADWRSCARRRLVPARRARPDLRRRPCRKGSDLVAGRWWPADYAGPPIVSLDREAARVMGVRIGDTLTVSVLGREIEARIASLREIHWDTMGFNYLIVFPPVGAGGGAAQPRGDDRDARNSRRARCRARWSAPSLRRR